MPDALNAGAAPEVFVSYARPDRPAAQALAAALGEAGLSVWWDRQLAGGEDFADVIAEHLAAARVVLVLWSRAAVNSNFVRDEASRARDAGKLLPLRIEDVQPPLGFGTIHTLDLIGWEGDRDDPAWQELLANLRRAPGTRPAPPAPAHPGRRSLPRSVAIAGLVLVLGAGGAWLGWKSWREQQALDQLQVGLQAHFAHDRNLQVARNAYLVALREDPQLGRAHYYLGHVYALLVLPRDARTQFELALRFASDLDDAQREDAKVQLAALSDLDAVAPVSRDGGTAAAPAVEPPTTPVPRPAPTVAPPEAVERKVTASAERAPEEVSRQRTPTAGLTGGGAARPSTGAPIGAAAGTAGAVPTSRTPTTVAAPPRLPRVPPSPERQRLVEARVDALFAPQAQARLEAATALAVDPGLAADALPLAIDRSLTALRDAPDSDATAAGVANTLQLLLAASPATLRAQADGARRLADAASALGDNQRAAARQLDQLITQSRAERPPVAYLQIASEAQRTLARALAARIRASGYEVPDIELVGARAPAQTEVRVQGGSAPGWGRWLAKVLGEVTGEPAKLSTLRATRPATDTFEIWLDKDLCAVRRVPACGD